MEKLTQKTDAILAERFGRDSIISLATSVNNIPHVRNVDAFYENGAFYVLTHSMSGKMKQIEQNPTVAICGEWFTAHGRGVNLGCFGKTENAPIASKMRQLFAAWIDNGHTDLDDPNTCILCIRLTTGSLFSNGVCYEIDFT